MPVTPQPGEDCPNDPTLKYPEGHAPHPQLMGGSEIAGTYAFKHARVKVYEMGNDFLFGCCYKPVPLLCCPMYRACNAPTMQWASNNNFCCCPAMNTCFAFTKTDGKDVMLWWCPCACCIPFPADGPCVCTKEDEYDDI